MNLHGVPMSDLIRAAFLDGYNKGRKDEYYAALKTGGNFTQEAAWGYSNTVYVYRDVLRLENLNVSKE